MTIKEYISEKFEAFGGVSESQLLDITLPDGMCLEMVYDKSMAQSVMRAALPLMEELLLAPKVSELGDGGSSVSYDFSDAVKYYLYLCKKFGYKANEEILATGGLSVIFDRTEIW